jgi:hypothetical protein
MAIYHLSAQLISRKAGRSSTGAAAYRAAEKVIDERTGEIHDYTRKRGVEHCEIITPAGVDWTPTRAELWNAMEAKNKRADAQLAREFVVALPAELPGVERQRLAVDFARHIADTYGVAADVAIHAPGRDGDQRNHHAHILTTTNTVTAPGVLGNKCRALDVVAHDRSRGERDAPNEVERLRRHWAALVNDRLQENGIEARIDHRRLEAQGEERAPTVHLGPVATAMERRGGRSDRGRINQQIVAETSARLFAAQQIGEIKRELAEIEQRIDNRTVIRAALLEAEERRQKRRAQTRTVEPPAGRDRTGPAVQSPRFRAQVPPSLASNPHPVTDRIKTNLPQSAAGLDINPPSEPLRAPQSATPYRKEGETLEQAARRVRSGLFEAERQAWRVQEAAHHREESAKYARQATLLGADEPKRPLNPFARRAWEHERADWARRQAEAQRLAVVHEIRERDTLKGEWDHHSGLRPTWEAAANQRLAREHPALARAIEEAEQRARLARQQQLDRERQEREMKRERTGPKRGGPSR